jgi:hypothetical protein
MKRLPTHISWEGIPFRGDKTMKKLLWVVSLLALSGELSALRNGCTPGTPNCGMCFQYPPPPGSTCKTDANGMSDFDADRKNDLLYRNQPLLDLQAWMRYAGGQAGWRTFTPRGMPDSHWVAVATGYFSYGGGGPNPQGDLYADILWQHDTTGQVRLWMMKNGQKRDTEVILTCPPEVDPCSDPAPPWEVVATGFFGAPEPDFEDGKSDILFWNSTTGELKLWIMDNSRVVRELHVNGPLLSTSWKVIGAGFFDAGSTDILWFNANTGEVQLWLMNGENLGSVWPVGTETNLDWKAVGVVDLNRDGAPGYPDGSPDILFRKKTTGRLRIWEMDGPVRRPGTVTPSIIEPSDLNWKPVAR